MSLLERVEDYIIKSTMTGTLRPVGHPPNDDGIILLGLWFGMLLALALTCGHYCAH
jgi:hypothetical protein